MPPLGSIHPMGTWDNGGAKIVVTPCHMTVRGNIPLANTKHIIEKASFNCIWEIVS